MKQLFQWDRKRLTRLVRLKVCHADRGSLGDGLLFVFLQ
jgi:hypothetical protein